LKQGGIFEAPQDQKDLYRPVQNQDEATGQPTTQPTPVAPNPEPVAQRPAPEPEPPKVVPPPPPPVVVKDQRPDKATYLKAEVKFDAIVRQEDNRKAGEELWDLSQKTADPVDRYVLLFESTRAFFRAGDGERGLAVLDEIGKQYDVNVLEFKLRSLEAARKMRDLPKTACTAATIVGIHAIADVRNTGRYDLLEKLAVSVRAVAYRAGEGDMPAQATALANDAELIGKLFAAARGAAQTMKTTPDDASANQAKGEFICFVQNDWVTGTPMLAKSADPELREVARYELRPPADAKGQLALADRWWKLGEDRRSMAIAALYKDRACYWYDKARSHLEDVDRLHAEKNLKNRPPRLWGAAEKISVN
jgi:hypothetical protein